MDSSESALAIAELVAQETDKQNKQAIDKMVGPPAKQPDSLEEGHHQKRGQT